MRTILRLVALLLGTVVVVFWLFGGPNTGFTKNRISHKEKDPVTEIEVEVFVPRFVPGIDFLGAGLGIAGLLAAGSFFFRRSNEAKPT